MIPPDDFISERDNWSDARTSVSVAPESIIGVEKFEVLWVVVVVVVGKVVAFVKLQTGTHDNLLLTTPHLQLRPQIVPT